jgi:hypothetical protein
VAIAGRRHWLDKKKWQLTQLTTATSQLRRQAKLIDKFFPHLPIPPCALSFRCATVAELTMLQSKSHHINCSTIHLESCLPFFNVTEWQHKNNTKQNEQGSQEESAQLKELAIAARRS